MPNNPGPNIDTGTGGFPVGENGVRVTYDVGSDVGDEFNKQIWDSGDINVDDEPKDLSRGTKSTLAAYLSDTTLGKTPSSPSPVRNKYAISHTDGLDPDNLSLIDNKGHPVKPDLDLGRHLEKFTQGKNLESRSKADTNLKIKRGRQDGTLPDGNDILKDVSPLAPPASALGGKFSPPVATVSLPTSNPVNQYYGSPNLSNSVIYNRFNQVGSNYEQQTVRGDSQNTDPAAAPTVAQLRGSFNKPSDRFQQFATKYEFGTSEVASRDVSFARLAQVGNALSTRAGFELNSFAAGNNPTDSGAEAAAILPGVAQLGITKIGRDRLTARSVLDALTSEGIGGDKLIDPAGESWGTLNNVNDQFAGISNFGMQLLAVALIVALTVAVSVTSLLFTAGTSEQIAMDDLGRKPYGRNLHDTTEGDYSSLSSILSTIPKFNFWRMMGIPATKNSLTLSVNVGALSFFGIQDPEATASTAPFTAAARGIASVTQSPGYYSVVARTVSRSFLLIGEAFSSLAKAFSSGFTSAIRQLFGIIDTLRNSKFLKILTIFARQGDKMLRDSAGGQGATHDQDSKGASVRYKSEIDFAPNRGYGGKGRLDTSKDNLISPLTLSWAAYRAPDLFIMPKNFSGLVHASGKLGSHNIFPSIPESAEGTRKGTYRYTDDNKPRIDTKTREAMENSLEAEYVPFYLHDVRTNEIISFHAFLASLNEDYSATYDTSEAIGRIDPIKVYKSTMRKIGFSFYIAATNERDFDSMWLKINKLTTLVYPQFSRGDLLSADGSTNQITIPFSQVVQAPPMVRLRIGDLFKSNYSRFNLARLFGYGDSSVEFEEAGKAPSEEIELSTNYEKDLETMFAVGNTFTTRFPLSRPVSETTFFQPEVSPDEKILLPRGLALRIVKIESSKSSEYLVCEAEVDDSSPELESLPAAAKAQHVAALKKYYEDLTSDTKILSKKFRFKRGELIPTAKTMKSLIGNKVKSFADYSSKIDSFMYDDEDDAGKGNAIAKSFRSSGGKGLAGFIESMSFDWYDRVTWETDYGRRAPKMCKVTVSFSPVHDITPGLDHRGINRAPIYGVRGYRTPGV